MTPAGEPRRPSPLFALVVGLLCGVLLIALVAPDHSDDADTASFATGDAGGPLEPGLAGGTDGSAEPDGAGATPGVAAPEAVAGATASTPVAGAGGGAGAPGAPATGRETGAPAAPGGPAGPAAPAAAGPGRGPVRGVTDDTVTIGIATLDLGAVRSLGPAFDNGDRRAHFEAILDGWRRAGLVPVNGRDVRFVYRTYGVFSAEERRSACLGLIQDAKALAVIGDSQFTVGIECVAREYRTVLVTSDSESDEVFARTAPNFFSLQMSLGRLLRNMVHWAQARGILKDKRIGIYSLDDASSRNLVDNNIKPELRRVGARLVAHATTDQALGGPGDALAVQRFRSERVDVAILLTSKAGFMQQAQAQGYRPRYIESDYLSGTTNTAASTYPSEHFDGTLGITGLRYGEWKAGLPVPPAAQACAAGYERFSGKKIEPNAREAEWVAMNKACDAANVLLQGLQRAGRALTPASLVAGIEGVQNFAGGIHPVVGFRPGKHDGVDEHRTVQFTADCRCWKAISPLAPLYVP